MWTPHPSLVPLEMASAGMLTVTNTYANKTAEALRAISENLVPAESSVNGVLDALRAAAGRVTDYEGRAAAAAVHWATDWEQAFPAALMHRLEQFLIAAMLDEELPGSHLRLFVA